MLAVIEELAGVGGHRIYRDAAALRASYLRGKLDGHWSIEPSQRAIWMGG